MSKFDLERALKGEPVVLRSGQKAYVRHRETELERAYSLMGYVVGEGKVDSLQWTESGHYYGPTAESGQDIVGMWDETLVFEHWNLLNEDIEYLAKDGDGTWYGYVRKPTLLQELWRAPADCWEITLKPALFPDCDWKESLIERPENE